MELRGDSLALALKSALDRLTPVLARAAGAFTRKRAWLDLGFARADDLARERFGRSGRWLRDLACLSGAFDRLPGLSAALAGDDGGRPLGGVAALQIARVATDDSLEDWIALARRVPVRALREAVGRALAAESRWPLRCDTENEDGAVVGHEAHHHDQDSRPRSGALVMTRWVRLRVPAAVQGAFGVALHLYRAVEGYAATVTSFVEALVAEATTGPDPVDIADSAPVDTAASRQTLESMLARATDNWSHLPGPPRDSCAFALARQSLQRFSQLEAVAGTGGPADLEAQIRALVDLEDELHRRLGVVLAEMGDGGAWSRLRFAGLGQYAEERLGMSRTTARDRAAAARVLRRFPVIRDAYDAGSIGLEATMRIVRAIGPGPVEERTQHEWVAHAAGITIKRLRDETRALSWRRAGVSGAVGSDTAGPPLPLTDSQWQASLRFESGMTRSRIGELGRLAAAAPSPDVFLELRLPEPLIQSLLTAMDSRRESLAPDDKERPGPDTNGSARAARSFATRGQEVPAWVGLLALIEEFVETWDPPAAAYRRRGDRIYSRDGWRCTTPACTSRRNLEMHHVRHRSDGGPDAEWNLATACRLHHQWGEHGGLASCRGTAPLGLTWRLGRKEVGVWYRNEKKLDQRDGASVRGNR